MRAAARTLFLFSLLALPFFRASAEEAREVKSEAVGVGASASSSAAVALTPADGEAIQKLFGQLSQAFLRGSTADALKTFAPKTAELRQVPTSLEDEFSQTIYKRFEAVEFRTSDAEWLRPNVWIVDVVLILESTPKQAAREAQKQDRAYRTSYPFIVQRMPDGAFMLRHSEFFQTLGLRHGPGFLLKGAGLIVLAGLALSFWVWMGWEATRERPRAHFWRKFVLVPGVGAVAYFLFRLVPRWTKRSGP